MPSTTWRLLRNGRPPCSPTDGGSGSINAHWASDRYSVRDTTPSVADLILLLPVGRHALVDVGSSLGPLGHPARVLRRDRALTVVDEGLPRGRVGGRSACPPLV